MVVRLWKFAEELLFFCIMGALFGVGICFIMFLHLGTPNTPENAGYVTALFVKSGVQLGVVVWMVRASARTVRRWFSADREKWPEHTQFPDSKIRSGAVDSDGKRRRFAALAKLWD
jgi:hypothetical protein